MPSDFEVQLSPELARKLMSESVEMREFVVFVKESVRSLNTLEDLPGSDLHSLKDAMEFSIEAKARKRACDILIHILEPLYSVSMGDKVKKSGDEYAIDVK